MSNEKICTCNLPKSLIVREGEAGEAPAERFRRQARQEPRPPDVFQSRNHIAVIKRFLAFVFVMFVFLNNAVAEDSTTKIREGMRLFSAEQFDEASKSFAAAAESLEKAKSDKAAIAAFDEACALHRKGDLELARDRYLKAGLSQDKGLATSAHFNIGVIASEQARKLAGETPETVPADKRKEILDEIGRSIDSYRHCLELQPQHSQARHNLELLRQWTKYYSDRWREADLQKRRDETNLIQFLEYLVQAQLSLKDTSEGLGPNASPNSFAELKRVQEELRNEIPYLKDKIDSELRPKEKDAKSAAASSISSQDKEDIERGIGLLSSWADDAGTKMANAGKDLTKREATAAAENQQRAADQLDQIWDAVVPFHPLLANELAQQTQIAKQLTPPASNEVQKDLDDSSEKSEESENPQPLQKLEVNDQEWSQLLKKQERVLRKARLLRPKAESELSQVESQPESQPKVDDNTSIAPPTEGENAEAMPKVDPEAIKAGYQKAIELAPKAVEEMEAAVKQLGKRDRQLSATHAEEAHRILQEIQDAQPKNPEQDQQEQKKDQDKDQQQDNEQKKDKDQEKDKKGDEGKDKEEKNKNDEKKQDKQQDEKKDEDKKDQDKPTEKRQEPKVSQDRIEEALRRVREREQEKRERDRELRARVLGRVPVDKDW